MSFNHRSKEKELLDNINIPFADIKRNMEELDFINRHLGGHNITLRGISSFKNTTELDIAEIGCGGGDNLRAIEEWSIKRGVTVKLTGIDINEECIRFAKGRVANKNNNRRIKTCLKNSFNQFARSKRSCYYQRRQE